MTGSSLNTFPVGYEYVNFVNWSKEISGNHILTCYPQNTDELLAVINWAHENKYCVRPVGIKHNWSPLVIANGEDNSNVVLIDLTRKFKTSQSIKWESMDTSPRKRGDNAGFAH